VIIDKEKAPPKPYVYQAYPAVRYKPDGQHKKVNDETEDATAAAEGFTAEPPEPGTDLIPAAITGPQKLAPPRTPASATKPVKK